LANGDLVKDNMRGDSGFRAVSSHFLILEGTYEKLADSRDELGADWPYSFAGFCYCAAKDGESLRGRMAGQQS
jgi:hypothetical protein